MLNLFETQRHVVYNHLSLSNNQTQPTILMNKFLCAPETISAFIMTVKFDHITHKTRPNYQPFIEERGQREQQEAVDKLFSLSSYI